MKWISTFIAVLYIYNILFDLISLYRFTSKKNVNNKEQTPNQTSNKDNITVLDNIVFLLSIIIYLIIFIYIILNNVFPSLIIICLLVVPTALRFLTNSIKASEPIKLIIFGKYSNQDLSIKEKISFDIIIGSFFFFFSSYYSDKLISYIVSLQVNPILIEILISIFILIYAFGLSFFSIEELMLPIKHIHKLTILISAKFGKDLNGKIDQFISYIDDGKFVLARFTNRFLSYSKRYKFGLKILLSILFLPYTLIIDIIMGVLLCVFIYFFGIIIAVFLEFARFIGKAIIYLVEKISNIPEHVVIKNTFRVSFILSATVMVILNRFSVFIRCDEAFLSVSEFIASAIIIPLIFEWIYSNDKKVSIEHEQSTEQLPIELLNSDIIDIKQNNNKKVRHKYKRKRKKQ